MINKIIKAFKEPYKILLRLDQKRIITLNDEKYLIYRGLDKGFKFDLNNPKTFNEKLQWLKLHDRNPLYTKLVDKYEVKNYISEVLGEEYIIPTIGVFDSFDKINFDELPNEFVIKCTHDSASVIVCKDKSKLDILECKKKINEALSINYYFGGREWPYKDVKPRILIEKYMYDDKFKELRDYKFFSFNGKVEYFKIDFDRFTNHGANYYDKNKKLVDLGEVVCPPNFDKKIEFPNTIDKMIELASKLSQGIPFVRVDFYDVNGHIYFGEMTFYPASGYGNFIDEEWDNKLGDLIDIGKVKEYEK